MVRSVTRPEEPEWDDATRAQVEALALYEGDCCPGCGLHKSIHENPGAHRLTFGERMCGVCKAKAAYGRAVAHNDELAGKHLQKAPPLVPRPGDGRHIFLRPMTADEIEKTRRDDG
jgi:hypothetical protein